MIDVLLSGTALLALSPVLAIIALIIKCEDGGRVIFRQPRLGRDMAPFTLLKFRSMPEDVGDLPSDKARALPITRIGRVIRRTNIDELPQLVNILRGDMSVVGPRPALPSQAELIELRTGNGASAVRPGLTGLAQVNSYDDMPESRKARYDGIYAARITLWGDIKIILRTFAYLTRPPPTY